MQNDQQTILPPAENDTPRLPAVGGLVIDNDTHTITYEAKSPSLLLAEATSKFDLAKELTIDSDFMYEEGAALLQTIVGAKKTLDEERLAATKPLRERTQTVNDGYKPAIDTYADGEKYLKGILTKYVDAKEAERLRLQRIADEAIAAQRREAERLAKEATDKANREAAEAQRIAQEEANKRLQAANAEAESIRLAAEQAEASGDAGKAAELNAEAKQTLATAETTSQMILAHGDQAANDALEQGAEQADAHQATANMITAPVMQMSRPRATGTSTSKRYTGEIVDPKLLLDFVIKNYDLLAHFVTFDQGAINRYAHDQKERMSLPGVELRTETNMASRRRA